MAMDLDEAMQRTVAIGEDLHERIVAAVAAAKQCPPKYLCEHCAGMVIAGDVVAAVDAGADGGERTAIVTVARTKEGKILVIGAASLELERAGQRIAEALASVRDAFARVGREAVLMQPLDDFSAFHASPDLRLTFSQDTIAKLQFEQAPRYYQNPSSESRYYDPPTENCAVRTHPTTNARGRWRRTKTKRCVKCNSIVNDGQTVCHRCGSKRIQ